MHGMKQSAREIPAASAPNVFRGAFHFANAPETILRFPFAFESDRFNVRVNVEPHDRTGDTGAFHALFDIDEHYLAEIEERNHVLSIDPSRCQSLPHMDYAAWEMLDFIMGHLAQDFPAHFTLLRDGENYIWHNRLLGIEDHFVLGRPETLPLGPLEYIARQLQGDIMLMDQRNDNLWLDAGMVTQAHGWSFDFILGMNWSDWHGPVVTTRERQVIERSARMTMAITPEQHLRRVNWLVQGKPRLDRSLEAMLDWRAEDKSVTADAIGRDLFFRVEFQQLYRLPRSQSVLFVLRHYFLSFDDLVKVPKWRMRLHRVLRDIDPAADRFRSIPQKDLAIAWLSQFDDGSPTSPGRAPDMSVEDFA